MIGVILILLSLTLLYFYSVRNFKYWKLRGVKYDEPVPFFGNCYQQFFRIKSLPEIVTDLYQKYSEEKLVGFYYANNPILVVRDPILAKNILVSDFAYFNARSKNTSQKCEDLEPMFKNIFFMYGDSWKLIRQKLTTVFSVHKIKKMIDMLDERIEKLLGNIAVATDRTEDVDVRDLFSRLFLDSIGSCCFGMNPQELDDNDSLYHKLGKRATTMSLRDFLVLVLKNLAPKLFSGARHVSLEVEQNLTLLVRNIIQSRNFEPSIRKDVIDYLWELQHMGKIRGLSIEKTNIDGSPDATEVIFDEIIMVAQVFIFLMAGTETTSFAATHTLQMLAFNRDVQKKCQKEIDDILRKHNNKLSYDSVNDMKYLKMTIKESLRKFSPVGHLSRVCTSKYSFPGTNLTIDKGTIVFIPVHGIHNDEKYIENPDQFLPERFSTDDMKHLFLPFGAGPRVCIGGTFATAQLMIVLAAILQKFTIAPSMRTKQNLSIDPTNLIVQRFKEPVYLKFNYRQDL